MYLGRPEGIEVSRQLSNVWPALYPLIADSSCICGIKAQVSPKAYHTDHGTGGVIETVIGMTMKTTNKDQSFLSK